MAYALDYSAGHPTPAAVRAAGYVGVIRYIGFDPAQRPKCISQAEYTAMTSGGVPVALVYENAAGDMLAGRAAGRVAATRARLWATRIGFPVGRPIYYACDTDIVGTAQMSTVLDYLRGCGDTDGTPARVGVYGEYDVIEQAAAAGVAGWFWQTRAWSAGRLSTRAHIRQEIGTVVVGGVGTVVVGGVGCDRNTVLAPDWGQTGLQQEADVMPTPDELWAVESPWPEQFNDLPHADAAPSMRDYLVGASVRSFRAARDAGAALAATQAVQVGLTRLAADLIAVRAAVGALGDDEAHVIAAVRESQAGLSAAVAEVLRELAEGGGGTPGPADPGFPDAVAERVIARLREQFDRPGPAA